MMKSTLTVAMILMLVAPTLALTQTQPRAAQEEFVPISELPPDEQLPAAPLLVGAYAFVWVALMAYLWSLWRKLGRVEQELAQVAGTLDRRVGVAEVPTRPGERGAGGPASKNAERGARAPAERYERGAGGPASDQ